MGISLATSREKSSALTLWVYGPVRQAPEQGFPLQRKLWGAGCLDGREGGSAQGLPWGAEAKPFGSIWAWAWDIARRCRHMGCWLVPFRPTAHC